MRKIEFVPIYFMFGVMMGKTFDLIPALLIFGVLIAILGLIEAWKVKPIQRN